MSYLKLAMCSKPNVDPVDKMTILYNEVTSESHNRVSMQVLHMGVHPAAKVIQASDGEWGL